MYTRKYVKPRPITHAHTHREKESKIQERLGLLAGKTSQKSACYSICNGKKNKSDVLSQLATQSAVVNEYKTD